MARTIARHDPGSTGPVKACTISFGSVRDRINLFANCERISSSYFDNDGLVRTLMEKEDFQNVRKEMVQIKLAAHKSEI